MHGYTLSSLAAVAAVVGLELAWLRTGLLRRRTFWIAYTIVVFFQGVVDGWLTKLSAPIVVYDPHHFLDVRFPWDVPVEDLLFGFAMVVLVLLLWERQASAEDDAPEPDPLLRRHR